ncbi:MAG TPA: DUF427 domain-containing protein [Candidatus Saccharimonadales bacterium]|jgi:uncharacterized protein (DUF427 family)
MKAIWNGQTIAEADRDELIYIEGNWYFPPASVKQEYLRKSDTPYTCPWKGVCQYYDVGHSISDDTTEKTWSSDNAWSYPEPLPSAIERVKKDFSGYVCFWRDVSVVE